MYNFDFPTFSSEVYNNVIFMGEHIHFVNFEAVNYISWSITFYF